MKHIAAWRLLLALAFVLVTVPGRSAVMFDPYRFGINLTFVAGREAGGPSSMDLPAGSAAGDVVFVVNEAINTDSTTIPTLTTPTFGSGGATQLTNDTGSPSGNVGIRVTVYGKVLNATDVSDGQITNLLSDNADNAIALTFRPDKAITSFSNAYSGGTMTGGDPADITSSGLTTLAGPVVILGLFNADTAITSDTFTPTENGEYAPSTSLFVKYRVYNSSPTDTTLAMGDEGARNVLVLSAQQVQ